MDIIKRILREEIKKLIMEVQMPSADEVTTSGLPILFRVGFKNQVSSVFKYGYNRQFAGMAGGLMYGVGTYCNDNLHDAQGSVGVKEYGDTIFKMYLAGGYYGFIIFNEKKARNVYGNKWRLEDQLKCVYNATDEEIRHIKGECDAKIRAKGGSYYHGRTAPAAHGFAQCKNFISRHQVKGVVYTGLRDGACVVPYDFGSIIPYSVSYDKGKSFKTLFNAQEYEKRINSSVDVQFHYGNKYKKVFEPVSGQVMVINNADKFNFVNIKTDEELSPYWFDKIIKPINSDTGEFVFEYKGVQLEGTVEPFTDEEGNTYNGCVLNEGEPVCSFDELDALINYIKSNNGVSENKIISESLDEDYGKYPIPSEKEIRGDNMTAIYRATPRENVESIFKYGYNRQFAGSFVGSAYGEGTYCMETFREALHNTPHYGETVMKMYVIGGFDHFLIYHESLAKQIYGKNWDIRSQLRNIFKIPDDVIRTLPISNPGSFGRNCQREIKKYGIRGMIYSWGAGHAVNVFDFSSIIPYSVYDIHTKKWETKFDMGVFNDRINNNIDVNFRYGEFYDKVFEGVKGFVMVIKNGKYNFVDIRDDNELSPYWFDMVNKPINSDTGEFVFEYKGVQLEGTVEPFTDEEGNTYNGCVLNEGEPVCSFDELDALIDYINSQQQ